MLAPRANEQLNQILFNRRANLSSERRRFGAQRRIRRTDPPDRLRLRVFWKSERAAVVIQADEPVVLHPLEHCFVFNNSRHRGCNPFSPPGRPT
jgi:hypothetical protein